MWDHVRKSETKWDQMRPSATKWDHVRPRVTKWDQVRPSETKWDQVRPCETMWEKWDQMRPNETKWDQVRSSETKWDQVRPSETNGNPMWVFPPLPILLIAHRAVLSVYILCFGHGTSTSHAETTCWTSWLHVSRHPIRTKKLQKILKWQNKSWNYKINPENHK